MTKNHFCAVFALALLAVGAGSPSLAAASGTFFVSAERNGRWEIYAMRADGVWGQITRGYSPARAPSLSSNGKDIAFQSHKEGNWEIYTLHLDSNEVTRLTDKLAYDGAPSWSPDGRHIAFESYRSGDLDIWTMNSDGPNPVNLTSAEPSYDYGPAWSPLGNWIAYTSWSTGNRQVWIASPDGKQRANLSQNQFQEEQPAWSPDGKKIAFVSNREGCEEVTKPIPLNACQRREIFVADFDGAKLSNVQQLTFDGRATSPAWSPDGTSIAYISPRPARQELFVIPAAGGLPHALAAGPLEWLGSAAWGGAEPPLSPAPPPGPPLYVEKPIPAPADSGHPFDLQELKQIYLAPSWGQMSSTVTGSLLALRDRMRKESGYDFLGVLSDMTRQLDYKCEVSCDNLSWHKAGRAVDTRIDYSAGRTDLLAVVREDQLGETYWRLYVRAAVQDGTLGEPLHDAPWDFSYDSRAVIAPQQGGVEADLPYGYYVDFTELAREYG